MYQYVGESFFLTPSWPKSFAMPKTQISQKQFFVEIGSMPEEYRS
jgi:hypothetical protein